jgi:phosphate transport system permease protein
MASYRSRLTKPVGRWAEILFHAATLVAALSVLAILLAILLSLTWSSLPIFLRQGLSFFTSTTWDPIQEVFGALPSIYGTLITSFIAMLIAIPVSFGIALYITEICPRRLRQPLSVAIQLLAGIPSIIYGMWGLFVFAPTFANHIVPLLQPWTTIPFVGPMLEGPPLGIGLLPAGIILGIMVIPFISSVMQDVFRIVPSVLKESAYALGCTTWEVLWKVILPYGRVPVVGGVMLGLGRALGETMAVTFVVGNAHMLTQSLLMPGTTLSATLANEVAEAAGLHRAALFALGLTLFILSFCVLSFAKWMLARAEIKNGH